MQNKKLFKVAIILLIAVFITSGIIACGGNDTTNPTSFSQGESYIEGTEVSGGGSGSSGDASTTEPEKPTEPEQPAPNPDNGKWYTGETEGKTFYGSSYREIYVPFHSPNWIKVSYNDVDRLDRLWKSMIDRGIKDGKRRMYIKTRDGDFFFDANYNIRWSKKPDTVLKWFQSGTIIRLRQGYGNNVHSSTDYGQTYSGKLALGGLYTFAMHASQARRLNSDTVNELFWASSSIKGDYARFGAKMEVYVLHPGIPVDLGTGLFRVNGQAGGVGWSGTAYGLQSYSAALDNGYNDGNYHIWNIKGNTPERYIPGLTETHQLYHLSFRWAMDKTYSPSSFVGAVIPGYTGPVSKTR